MKKYKKGFTLLELIVVIAIIGILAAITVAFLGDAKNRGNDTGKIQALMEARKALQMYYADKNGFPTSTTTLVSSGYISSIDSRIIYDGITCTDNCQSYHMGIVLTDPANSVFKSDADVDTTIIKGLSSNCLGGTGVDLCYDLVP